MGKKYDVFISYRRLGGEQTAKIICDRLTDLGYRVFYDVEALRSGDFNTKLYSVIDECDDVIVVLSQNSLDRCSDENDWVRLEIAHALEQGKNVVPVFLRGFAFPDRLPENIGKLRYMNGLEANSDFFDAFIQKLQTFLKSKPTFFRRIGQNILFKRMLPFLLALAVILALYLGISAGIHRSSRTFPVTQEQKNITEEIVYYIEQNLTNTDIMANNMSKAYEACSDYLSNGDAALYKEAVSMIDQAYGEIDKIDFARLSLSENISSKIDKTPINKADLVAVNGYSYSLKDSFKNDLTFLKQTIDQKNPFDTATKRKIVNIYKDILSVSMSDIAYGINELLLPVDKEYLTDFTHKYLPMLTSIPFGSQVWLTDKTELERLLESNYNQQEKLVDDLTAIVGNLNYETNQMENQSSAAAEKQKELDAAKDAAREKFAPKDSDEPGMLWAKMLRFIHLEMGEDAIKCAEMYQSKVIKTDPDADTYVPAAIRFIEQIPETGVDYGVLVCGYEPGKPAHSVYKVGDIIIGINNTECKNYDGYNSLKPADTAYTAVLLRPDENNKLKPVTVSIPAGESRILLFNMTENE